MKDLRSWVDRPFRDRNSKGARTIRADFDSGSANLLMAYDEMGNGRTQVGVAQSKLAGQEEVEAQRAYWKAALDKLQRLVS
jgi:hypothetical protein